MADLTNLILHRVDTELALAPVEAPPRIAPPNEAPPQPPRPRRVAVYVALACIVVLALAIVSAYVSRRATKSAPAGQAALSTATVERRDFVRSLRLSGTIQAVESYVITSPQIVGSQIGQLVITKLAAAGAHVKAGDLLVEFDRQGQIQDYLDRKAEYQALVDQITKKQADEAVARAKDDTELKQAEDDLSKAQLEMQKNEIAARIDAEKNELNREEAEARLKQLKATYALKRAAARADLRDLEIQRDSKQAAMLHARRNEEKMAIHSPADGIVVLASHWKGNGMGESEEGDRVWAGVPLLFVVNPGAMEVRANVNQVDLPYLEIGQPARVQLDAYPGVSFNAKLEQLGPVGDANDYSDKLRTFNAVVSIDGSDPRLMPDLSAAVDVELARLPNSLVMPRECVSTENGKTLARVKKGLGFEKKPVETGAMNDTEAVIEAGLSAGDVLERNPAP